MTVMESRQQFTSEKRNLTSATPPVTLHLAVASAVFQGKHGREYRGFDAEARPLFVARALRVPGAIQIFDSTGDEAPWMTMKPRWTFPFTGKYDIRRTSDGQSLGIARRNGWLSNTDGRKLARFKDARSMKGMVGESVAQAVFEAALGGDGSTCSGAGSDSFILLIGDSPAGSLVRERLPFIVDPPKPPPTSGCRKWVRAILPKSWFKQRPPRGWKLNLAPDAVAIDRSLLIAQALLTAEISAW